jgi:hypothetical protein
MHPVLAKAIHPVAEQIATVTLAEAQVSANSELRRWSGQEVVEHLILSIQKSKEELQRRLKSKNSPFYSCTFIQWVIKFQLLWFGSMPRGIPATHSLSPHRIVAQDGPALAARLLSEAEELSKALAECRIAFGVRPCGNHPIYGPLRVEEWRRYHAVHCRHHLQQFKEAIDFARKHPMSQRQPEASVAPVDADAGEKSELPPLKHE